jgi:hypothetical protein
LNIFLQNAQPNRGHTFASMFRHLGALGLFFLAILDSSPLPTFGGPDILIAILAASHRNPGTSMRPLQQRARLLALFSPFESHAELGRLI